MARMFAHMQNIGKARSRFGLKNLEEQSKSVYAKSGAFKGFPKQGRKLKNKNVQIAVKKHFGKAPIHRAMRFP